MVCKRLGRRSSEEPGSEKDAERRFVEAAHRRWSELGQELKTDVAEFNSRGGGASYSEPGVDQYRIENSRSGMEITITADFEAQVVRYEYAPLNQRTAGTPEGGMLSMRRCPQGTVEFYSADERLTRQETREVLLQPVLSPPQMAA